MDIEIDNLIQHVRDGNDLTEQQTAHIFSDIMGGELSETHIDALLTALADKGESVDEIVGAARVMRKHAVHVACDNPNAIDTCGTGGDGISTFNVSTAAAIVAAAAGACVAKHGNRSNTRRSGSAEVLVQLGVDVEARPDIIANCLAGVGIAFLHAARLHPAMQHVAQSRRRLARPTIFNLLGPLTNPAGVQRQVIGVPRLELTEKLAQALAKLGAVHVIVVHGAAEGTNGLCDFTVTGESTYVELRQKGTGEKRGLAPKHEVPVPFFRSDEGGACPPSFASSLTITPESLGLAQAPLDALTVDSPYESAAAIRNILQGEKGPRRDHTLLNTAAALVVAGIASDLKEGVTRASHAIDSKAAMKLLERWITCSRGHA